MNIQRATREYESWMRACTTVVQSDLRSKHEQMRDDLFMFFRGTFYRWAQLWPEVSADLRDAPKVIAVGDLHVNSFGTWRDSEGRLAWGVDDFDEAYPLPYTNDLVRLAASVKIVNDSGHLTSGVRAGCEIILEGYEATLKSGGRPMVLAEHEKILEKLGIEAIKPPEDFWKKLNALPAVRRGLPQTVKKALEKTLPDVNLDYKVVLRKAGMGSLGQQRFVAIAQWQGGCIAREAKAMVPSGCAWLDGNTGDHNSYYQQAISSAVRARDPFQIVAGEWLIRRLSPDSNPVDIASLPKKRDEHILLHAMGSEAANVHLGSRRQVKNILKNLHRRKPEWLRAAGKEMAGVIEKDWKKYRQA
jgi:uncharacterized protein (DUF2252 family)